jgi:hypothetical protein
MIEKNMRLPAASQWAKYRRPEGCSMAVAASVVTVTEPEVVVSVPVAVIVEGVN